MPGLISVDAELLVIEYLKPLFAQARVVAETPAELPEFLVRVERIGGGDTGHFLDAANIDIDCFAPTRPAVNQFAAEVKAAVKRMVGYTARGAVVTQVRVDNFGWRPYTNTNVRSAGMTAELVLQQQT